MKARVIEIFSSIQGEGLWVGRPQVFVRFHGCRLQCSYCDTPLTHKAIRLARVEYPPFSRQFEVHPLEFDMAALDEQIRRFNITSLALTGGEPLEQADFMAQWLNNSGNHYEVLLETSGVEVDALHKVISRISLISMDVKIPSATGERALWDEHDRFIQAAGRTPLYLKIVYHEQMTTEEKKELTRLLHAHPNLTAVFQPVSPLQKRDMPACLSLFNDFAQKFPERVRVIPQVHKFLGVL